MKHVRKSAFVVGFAFGVLAVGLVLWGSFVRAIPAVDANQGFHREEDQDVPPDQRNSPVLDGGPHTNPLGDGTLVTASEAQELSSYDLPTMPVDELTGDRTGIWIDGEQVAYRWSTNLRCYVDKAWAPEEELAREWIADEDDPNAALPGARIVEIGGHVGRGHQSDEAGLTFARGDLVIQCVSEKHSLDELVRIAESIGFSK